MDIISEWNNYKELIKPYSSLKLNGGCSENEILQCEKILGCDFPEDLRQLYLQNNGEKENSEGIFKIVYGYDIYRRAKFLRLEDIKIVWRKLYEDKEIQDVFFPTDIPFACNFYNKSIETIFCIDSRSQNIYLLSVLAIDWTLPVDWQTSRKKRAENLVEFLQKQRELY